MDRASRILLIENERAACNLLCPLLEGEGYEVCQAQDYSEALVWIEQETFDLVLVDISMEGMDGLEMLRHVQASCKGATLIVVADRCPLKTALEAIRYNAADYLSKPFRDPGEILAAVHKALAEQKNRGRHRPSDNHQYLGL